MKKLITQTCLFLILSTVLIITSTANLSSASAGPELQINNLAGQTTILTYENITTMPKTSVSADLYCGGALLVSGEWIGVKLSDLLYLAGLDPKVNSVEFIASDGYRASIPLAQALRADVIVAYERDGTLLSEGLRLVIPGEGGNVWIAQMASIIMSDQVASGNSGQAMVPLQYADATQGTATTATPQPTATPQTPQTQQNPPQTNSQKPEGTPENIQSESPTPQISATPQKDNAGSQTNGFPVEGIYGIALVAFVLVLAVGFAVFRRRQ